MRQKISFKGVLIGAIADVVGTNIWGFGVVMYISAKYRLYALPQAEQTNQLYNLASHDFVVMILGVIIGGAFTILGGYIAARIAKHDELLNGTLASFLCVLFVLLSIGSSPVVDVLIGIIANPILGFFGGYLRLWQRRKNESFLP